MRREILLTEHLLDNTIGNIFLAILAEMGIGKSHSIKNVAVPWAYKHKKRIAIITHRNILKDQSTNELQGWIEKINREFCANVLELVNFQRITTAIKRGEKAEWLNKFDMVLIDEAHAIVTDSWGGDTDIFMKFLEEVNVPKILFTGTPDYLDYFINKWDVTILREVDLTNNDVGQVRVYYNSSTFFRELRASVSEKCKVLVFVNGPTEKVIELAEDYIASSFVCSESNKLYSEADHKVIKEIKDNSKNLSTNLIFSTSVWTEGVNIKDPNFKVVASLFPTRPDDFYQQVARAREFEGSAACIVLPPKSMLGGIKSKNLKELAKGNLLETREQFLLKHNKDIDEILKYGYEDVLKKRYPTVPFYNVDQANYDSEVLEFLGNITGLRMFQDDGWSPKTTTSFIKGRSKNWTQNDFLYKMVEEFNVRGSNRNKDRVGMKVIQKWLNSSPYPYKLEKYRDRSSKSETNGKWYWVIERLELRG